MEDAALLKKMELFHGLSSFEIVQISKRIGHLKVEAGQVVIEDGSFGTSLYIVRSGHLVASVPAQGRSGDPRRVRPGRPLRRDRLIDHGPRSAEIRAGNASELLELDREAFQAVLNFSTDLRIKIMENLLRDLCVKIRRTNDRLLQML
jgi:CRP-like cAMP-binding protein